MLLDFFYALRARKVPVATQDWLLLLQGLERGLHESSLDGYYHLARAILVKDLAHYDAFDTAFLEIFRGVTAEALAVTDELLSWLAEAERRGELSEEELAKIRAMSLEEVRALFARRLAEQRERHDGGNRWIGTQGTSPFGSRGNNPAGIRVGEGGGRSAMQVASERRFREYRNDVTLDVRRLDLALRLLRDLGREGADDELDLDATVDCTARNAGDLEVILRPPRRNRMKLVLLMDVGGSMDPYSHLVSQLFTAASRSGRFASFRAFYFHNCVYDAVYTDARFTQRVPLAELFGTSDREERLVVVGDAAMHPAELLEVGGSMYALTRSVTPGIEWMRRIHEHFRHAAWLNPEPETYWGQATVQVLAKMFAMFPLTIDGLSRAVRHLVRVRHPHALAQIG